MDSKIIFGRLDIVGRSPDGDSVRFVPSHEDAFDGIYRDWKVKLTGADGAKGAQLRLEGIDTPETHYGPDHKQPHGETSRSALLKYLGIDPMRITWDEGHVASYDGPMPELVIATAGADANGRPISFVWPRNKAPSDLPANGTWGILKPPQLAKSANYELVRTGNAYATLYASMPREQRAEFRAAAMGARGDGLGVWKQDATESFFFGELADVEENGHLVLPKLFRRLVDYSKSLAQGFDGTLEDWLRGRATGPRPEDDRVVLNDHVDNVDSIETSLSEILETINGRITLKTDVNHVVFVEK